MAKNSKVQDDIDELDRAESLGATARLQIRYAADMSEETKLRVAEWLRNHAEDLLANGHEYAIFFEGFYNPEEDTER